jgi:altronate dehydratase
VEIKLNSSQGNLTSAEAKIKELEALLAQSKSGGGGDATLKSELKMVSKERDDLRDRLKEFEVIADDLANLKRLQQENDQLRKSLAAQGQKVPDFKEEAPKAALNQAEVSDLFEDLGQGESKTLDNAALEDFLSSAAEADLPQEVETIPEEPVLAAAEVQETKKKSDKTPEDLLSEFEKMLG